jgi:hypothetical protein
MEIDEKRSLNGVIPVKYDAPLPRALLLGDKPGLWVPYPFDK